MRDLPALLTGAKLHLGLSRTGLTLFHLPSLWRREAVRLFEAPLPGGEVPDLAAALAPALAGGRYAGLPLAVTLGDDWVRLFMVPPPANAASPRDIAAAAAMRLHTLYGEASAGWRLDCAASADRPFLACALPGALFASIEAAARAHRLKLVSVVPLFAASWNQMRHRLGRAWLGVVQGNTVTLGCADGAVPELAAVHRLTLRDGTELRDQLRSVALRYGLADPPALRLFGSGAGRNPVPAAPGLDISWIDAPPRGARGRRLFIPVLGVRQ